MRGLSVRAKRIRVLPLLQQQQIAVVVIRQVIRVFEVACFRAARFVDAIPLNRFQKLLPEIGLAFVGHIQYDHGFSSRHLFFNGFRRRFSATVYSTTDPRRLPQKRTAQASIFAKTAVGPEPFIQTENHRSHRNKRPPKAYCKKSRSEEICQGEFSNNQSNLDRYMQA